MNRSAIARGILLALTPILLTLTPNLASTALAQETPAMDQDAMMAAWAEANQPGEEHAVLNPLVGTWDTAVKIWFDPAGEPIETTGSVTYEWIMNGRFLLGSYSGDFMGQPFEASSVYGYNTVTGEYQAGWIDNHSTGIYNYTGTADDEGNITWTGEYTEPMSGETVQSKSEMEWVSEDEIHETGYEMRDGEWVKSMEIVYQRKAAGE